MKTMLSFLKNGHRGDDVLSVPWNKRLISSKSSSVALLRLQKDLEELSFQSFCARGTTVKIQNPYVDGIETSFTCTITPAEESFAHGTFVFMIQVPRTYPFSPPSVKCLNRVFHPNFDFRTGAVYLPILSDGWRPVLTMNTVIFSLQLLFLEPISPATKKDSSGIILNQDAHRLRHRNPERFEQLVRETMRGGYFFGKHWATTLRNGPDGTDPPIRSIRKRRYPRTQGSRKRRHISLSDLQYLSLNDSETKVNRKMYNSSTSWVNQQNLNRKRSLDVGYSKMSIQKRRKRPSSVLDDESPNIYLPNPDLFLKCEEDVKHTFLRQPVMMDEDI